MTTIIIPNTLATPAADTPTTRTTKTAPDITLTPAAEAEFRRLEEEDLVPRLVLAKAGCCSYKFLLYPDKQKGADTLTRIGDYSIIIDPQVQEFADRLTIDYGRIGLFRDFIVKPR